MEDNLKDKVYYDKLVKATTKYIRKVGLKHTGTAEAKIKKCIETVIMPWYFSPALIQVSSKAGQGKKNLVKISGTRFIALICDSINYFAGEGVANQTYIETTIGDFLRRTGSKLRKEANEEEENSKKVQLFKKAKFSPYKKTPLKRTPTKFSNTGSKLIRTQPVHVNLRERLAKAAIEDLASSCEEDVQLSQSDYSPPASTQDTDDEVYIFESDLK